LNVEDFITASIKKGLWVYYNPKTFFKCVHPGMGNLLFTGKAQNYNWKFMKRTWKQNFLFL